MELLGFLVFQPSVSYHLIASSSNERLLYPLFLLIKQSLELIAMGAGAGRGKFKGKPTGRRHFSTPEEMGNSCFVGLNRFNDSAVVLLS